MAVEWDVSKADARLIVKMAERAEPLFTRQEVEFDRTQFCMDVTAVHRNGCPLRLAELLAADEFEFLHDIAGIRRFVDRSTGELTRGFHPRFAV